MKQSKNKKVSIEQSQTKSNSRRNFLKLGATSGAMLATGSIFGLTPTKSLADDFSSTLGDPALNGGNRAYAAASLKIDAAKQHLYDTLALGTQFDNNDEGRYRDERFYASFSKTLPSNQFAEVEPSAFKKMRRALRSGEKSDFDAIPLSSAADRRLADPQGALKFEISALDSHATRINPSHKFRSAKIAAEVGEVYWQAITRDVPFIDYDSSSLILDAVSDLNAFSKTAGATTNGNISADSLFRGETPGDLNGPFISQFLLRDFNFGSVEIVQRYQTPVAAVDFMLDTNNWLNIQRGGAPNESVSFDPVKRYIYNNRSLSEYVHRDVLFQAYLNACLQLLSFGPAAIDSGNPYVSEITNQGSFTSLGGPFILDMVTRAGNLSLTGAWFQKWRVHRFLRPEAYGGRIHFNMTGQRNYEIHSDILNSSALQNVFSQQGTYLLPQAYIEGSPTHPSYPAGHATVAGACVTVLKAFFNEDFVIENPVQSDAIGSSLVAVAGVDLTVGGELNKLANNISIGRDAAGVHYRQDGVQGLESGEQQGIALLQDQSRTLNESNFDGFTLTKFDGQTIKIKDGYVYPV